MVHHTCQVGPSRGLPVLFSPPLPACEIATCSKGWTIEVLPVAASRLTRIDFDGPSCSAVQPGVVQMLNMTRCLLKLTNLTIVGRISWEFMRCPTLSSTYSLTLSSIYILTLSSIYSLTLSSTYRQVPTTLGSPSTNQFTFTAAGALFNSTFLATYAPNLMPLSSLDAGAGASAVSACGALMCFV